MLGLVSTTAAWAAIQSSFHGGKSGEARSEYELVISSANNMWITSEVKYRDDLSVWKDKQVRVFVDGMDKNDFFIDVKTMNGSSELYEFAMPCFIENPKKQLPECKPYMDALYDPYNEEFDKSNYWMSVSESEGNYSNKLQMITGLFAVALFLLGITAVMKIKNLVSYLVIFSIVLWLFGIYILLSIPVVFS
jgi:hypothetical protein